MSTAHDSTADRPEAAAQAAAHNDQAAELPCEPDDVPVRFLAIISAGLTAIVIVLVAIAVWAFNVTSASELKAKGYDVTGHVPEQHTPAEKQQAPAKGAPE